MPIYRARSIDELYAAVADYDLVLTTDAPLSHALNQRIDEPRLGTFATTPRRLAAGTFRTRGERELFIDVVGRTDLGWKHAAHRLSEVLDCWTATGDRDAILEYERFADDGTRQVIEVLKSVESAYRDLNAYRIDDDRTVAVIGEEQFTALDRSILPDSADTIDPLTDETVELSEFRVFDSRTDIVDAAVDAITPANASHVAIVMDRGSAYPALVEAALAATDVPFYGGPGFAAGEGLRTFIRTLRLAEADERVRVRDVRPILSYAGVSPASRDDEKFLADVAEPTIERVTSYLARVEHLTFDEALAEFEDLTGRTLSDVREEFETLAILDELVSARRLDDLTFYLQTYEVPVDRDDEGVVLADASSAAYVDRPVVFSLGMGANWTHRVPDRPWIDAAERDRQALRQFQLLLQNGQEHYYLVQDTRGGEPIRPCLYFHDLLDGTFERFTDLPHVPHTRPVREPAAGFDRDRDPVSGAGGPPVETMSQSGLSTFVNCPRDYFFDELVETPDRDYFRKGNLFHDYAEFAVAHPAFVDDLDREELVAFMLAELDPFVDDIDRDLRETEFAAGLAIIDRFLAEDPPEIRSYEGYEGNWSTNVFAEHYDREIDSPVTELWFENPSLGGKGKVDLVQAPDTLLDYKSGSRTSASKVVSRSAIEEIHDEPDFQALLYLAHHRRTRPAEPLEFVFFHFLEVVDEVLTAPGDLDVSAVDLGDALVRIPYHPQTFPQFAGSEAAFEALTAGVAESNNRRKTLETMGVDAYTDWFDRHAFPDVVDADELLASTFARQLTDHAKGHVGDYAYVANGIESALKRLWRIRGRRYFREDVDAFEAFLDEQIERLNDYRTARFPVGDPNFDRVTHRDLIRPDD